MRGKLRWLGSAFISGEGKSILFDPWTASDGNGGCPYGYDAFAGTDLILVSHDHLDHIGSAASICRQSGALLGGPDESMKRLCREEGLSPGSVVNDGGGYIVGGGFENEWIKVVSTPAHHSSDTSMALGTIAILREGPTLYHTGDTGPHLFWRQPGSAARIEPLRRSLPETKSLRNGCRDRERQMVRPCGNRGMM